jgi:FAD/FMN-containing dehydrogenase
MELTYPIDSLRRRFRGALLRRGEEGYDEARRVWNGAIDRYPALVARCAGADDVTAAVSFARERDRSVSVKGGGHAVAGHAICDNGIVIDLSLMNRVEVDPRARTAQARAARARAAPDGRTWIGPPRPTGWPPPAGSSRTGIGKLTLGGGLGHLMRRYRLTVDNLLCVDLVTADWTVTPPMHWRPIGPELPPGSVLSGSRSAARRWPRAHQTNLDQTLTTVLTVVADCASSRSELVLDAVLPAAG